MELAKMPQVSVVRLHTVSSTEYLENGSCCSAGQTKAGLLPCYTRDSGHAATSRPLYLKEKDGETARLMKPLLTPRDMGT